MTKFPYHLVFRSKDAFDKIEAFLEAHCQGNWSLELDDVDIKHGTKRLKALFENEHDKMRIDGILSGTRPAKDQRKKGGGRRHREIEWNPIFERRKSPDRRS